MDRKEAYGLIKKYDLASEVMERFGENYTRVKTSDLERVIWDYDATLAEGDPYPEEEEEEVEENTVKTPQPTVTEDAYEAACLTFLAVLKEAGKLEVMLDRL